MLGAEFLGKILSSLFYSLDIGDLIRCFETKPIKSFAKRSAPLCS